LNESFAGKLESAKQINWPMQLGIALLVALLSAIVAKQL
jgi:hypothetical protein